MEIDEDVIIACIFVFFRWNVIFEGVSDPSPIDDQSRVTNEVLKRAENAIFARAINAIRPIEIKKICQDRQRLYSNDATHDDDGRLTPTTLSSAATDKAPVDNSLQITLNNSEKERSVEIRGSSRHRNKTPVRSIRERLGKKIGDGLDRRSGTPECKIPSNRNDLEKGRSKDKHHEAEKHKPANSSTGSKRHDSRDRQKSADRQAKDRGDRSRTFSAKDRKNKPDGSSRCRSSSRDKRDHSKEKTSRSNDSKENSRGSALSRDRRQADGSTSNREREVDKARELARARESNRANQKQPLKSSTDRDRGGYSKGSKEPRDSKDSKDWKHGYGGRSDDRTTTDTSDTRGGGSAKRPIDESNFEPDYEEQSVDDAATGESSRTKRRTVDHPSSKRCVSIYMHLSHIFPKQAYNE